MEFSYSKDVVILNGIDLDISGPQLISIIGPNGVGKSTLIHCLDRILKPTKGTVMLDDQNVDDYQAKELAKKMGYVPYTSGDSFPMTVVDTVLMGRNPHRKWKSLHQDMIVVEEAMRMMDISDLSMRYFNELSAGQHQRVMLARGIAQEPEVLLLDEPTANLDPDYSEKILRLLETIHAQGTTVLVATQDPIIAGCEKARQARIEELDHR